ncbi:putative quinol monooxygenase [Sinorhizobium fredii]|uniref:putative quinol monooxygenase n=1 Tax=Rhizobium fredii TaxID=380 RepID=UPI003518C69C
MPKNMNDGAPRNPDYRDLSHFQSGSVGHQQTDDLELGRRSLVTTVGLAAAAAVFSAPITARAAQSGALPKGAVTVVAIVRARDGKEAELVRATEVLVPKVRQEEGNLLCQFHQGLEEPGVFVFYEIFESAAALEAHKETPHVKQWAMDVQSLTAGPVELKLLQALG